MKGTRVAGLAAVALLGLAASAARGQVVEAKTKVTGPRGRSIERDVRSERGPGYVQRDIHIQRPGGTFDREVRFEGPRAHVPPVPAGRVVERDVYVRRPPVVVEREVIVQRPGPRVVGGGPFFGLYVGPGLPPPPPPVVVVPEPVVVAPAPTVVVQQPQRYRDYAPPPTVVIDPVNEAVKRLQSGHDNSRRDGCLTLGRLGDARGVPSLVDRLQGDDDREVRQAAAWALGEIGDPRAEAALRYAARHDRKDAVREAAARAITRLAPEGAPVAVPAPPAFSVPSEPLPEPLPGLDGPR